MTIFALFAMTWAAVVGVLALALVPGYRLPIGRSADVTGNVQSVRLLDVASLES